ncbi:MAG: hypothetical protein U0441_01700 [Polyangiaceae bacterium]
MRRFPLLLWLFACVLPAVAGCYPYDTTPKLCEDAVPKGGCPTGRGGTCDDPTCDALYDCIDAKWKKISTCSASTGGGGAGGDTTSSGGAGGQTSTGGTGGAGGDCTAPGFDHAGETTGCTPDLQVPDCPVSAAEPCAETACATGCSDFYLCQGDASAKTWVAVGYCDDSGHLVITPP